MMPYLIPLTELCSLSDSSLEALTLQLVKTRNTRQKTEVFHSAFRMLEHKEHARKGQKMTLFVYSGGYIEIVLFGSWSIILEGGDSTVTRR